MAMDWENERYVRWYTRDTTTWKLLHWHSRAVLGFLIRKVDRAGVLAVGDDGISGLAAHIEVPEDVATFAIDQLIARGVVVQRPDAYVLPKFLDAQEASQSDKMRAKEYRARNRDKALGIVTPRDVSVTNRDASVTPRDDTVTLASSRPESRNSARRND